MAYEEFPEHKPAPEFSKLQEGCYDDGLGDVPGFTKSAAGGSRELLQSDQDALWAGSNLLSEELECERHLQRMIDEDKLPYVVMEKALVQMGYKPPRIRRVFEQLTGIDPVRAYLDTANFPIPPGAVPRWNYGWGKAKGAKEDYFFILPWVSRYGLFKQVGLSRELVEEFDLVKDAREALEKKVESFHDVEPNGVDLLTDIIGKTAEVMTLSAKGAEAYQEIARIASADLDLAGKKLVQAHEDGSINDNDFRIIAEKIVLAGPDSAMDLTAPERVDQKEFERFKEDQEGRSFNEMRDNTLLPGQEFASNWRDHSKVDFWALITNARSLFEELATTIQGYSIEPSWGTFRVMETPNLAVDDDNHMLDGSVVVGATAKKLGSDEETGIALLLFVHNGKLKYSGKFKGVNNREYAFTTQGLEDYFDDLSGSTAIDTLPGRAVSDESMNQVGPSPSPSFQI